MAINMQQIEDFARQELNRLFEERKENMQFEKDSNVEISAKEQSIAYRKLLKFIENGSEPEYL